MNNKEQEKIYIDIDEEITTVIDHLNQVKNKNVVIIVPQHALLLQSVVNLKLLEQEAKKRNKTIVLMTRDEDGIAFAQRAGIEIQPFVSGEDERMNYVQEISMMPTKVAQEQVPQYAQKIMDNNVSSTDKRLDAMGSQTFFASNMANNINVAGLTPKKVVQQETIIQNDNRVVKEAALESISTMTSVHDNKVVSDGISYRNNGTEQQYTNAVQQEVNGDRYNNESIKIKKSMTQADIKKELFQQSNNFEEYEASLHEATVSGVYTETNEYIQANDTNANSQKTVEKRKKKKEKKKRRMGDKPIKMSEGTNFAMKGFVIVGLLLVAIVLFIFILPKTKITIEPKQIEADEVMEMTAKTDLTVYDAERRLIPARLIERDMTFTKTFNSTGTGDVEAQKAQGKITIVNEYNDKPQALVATTRFLSESGVLFRLVNNVTVPGKIGEEPGTVEALVMADKPGVAGNIGPSKFSIPGFDNGPKEDKFYGISDKSMTGGGTGGTGVAIVTQEDIDKAAAEMNDELNEYIKGQLAGLLRPDNEILTDEAITYEIISSETSVGGGTMSEQFMYEIVSHVKALVFSQDDVLSVMESNLSEKYHQYDTDQVDVEMEYNDVKADFENELVEMNVYGMAEIIATVDVNSFEEAILSKTHDELLNIIETDFSDEIEKIIIESIMPGFPSFIANRISRFEFMTDVTVK